MIQFGKAHRPHVPESFVTSMIMIMTCRQQNIANASDSEISTVRARLNVNALGPPVGVRERRLRSTALERPLIRSPHNIN
jgi:hypothetical protein